MKLQADHQVQYFPLTELKITPNMAGRVPKSLNQQDTITLNSNGIFAHFSVLFFFFTQLFTLQKPLYARLFPLNCNEQRFGCWRLSVSQTGSS